MRKLLFLPMVALFGCGSQSYEVQQQNSLKSLIGDSTIVCADGNQVRMAVYVIGGNATAFSGWTILDQDGKPKQCVKRAKAAKPQYEEVPEDNHSPVMWLGSGNTSE